jgi:hypothetical protein
MLIISGLKLFLEGVFGILTFSIYFVSKFQFYLICPMRWIDVDNIIHQKI